MVEKQWSSRLLIGKTYHFIIDRLCIGSAVVGSIVGEQFVLPFWVVDLNRATFGPHLHHLDIIKILETQKSSINV